MKKRGTLSKLSYNIHIICCNCVLFLLLGILTKIVLLESFYILSISRDL